MFCERTREAVVAFQIDEGLPASGIVDDETWVRLGESRWSLGERVLFLRSPNLRGADVARLQASLNRLGFDCGRVDGIFGPLAERAVAHFQSNCGLEATGVCTPEFVDHLARLGAQSGDGPGAAVMREGAALVDAARRAEARLIIGHFPGMGAVAHALTRRLHGSFHLTTNVDSDASSQARAANVFRADAYLGFEAGDGPGILVRFYEVPTFVSVGGRNLATRVAAELAAAFPGRSCSVEGVRHPVLRETRMPAVLCTFGPLDTVVRESGRVAEAVATAWHAWWTDPAARLDDTSPR